MKQGEENFDFVKEDDKTRKRNYIFQKNTKTRVAFFFVAAVLILLIIAVSLTGGIS